jgi:protein TonB
VAAAVVALLLTRAQQAPAPARVTPDATGDAPAVQPAEPAAAEPGLTEVDRLLDAASGALQQQRYIDPVEDNALDHYLAVLELEPENPEAAAGLDTIAGVLLERAQTSLGEGRPDDALMVYGIAQEIRPAHPDMPLVEAVFMDHGRQLIAHMNLAVAADDWTRAREHLDLAAYFLPPDSTEIAEARALLAERLDRFAIAERVALADERITANSLTVPENDSAKFHLLALEAEHPEDAQVDAGLERLAAVMLERADSALLEENFEGAERWLAEVGQLGVAAEALAERREALLAAQTPPAAEVEPEPVPAGEATVAGLNGEPAGAPGAATDEGDAAADADTAPGAADYLDPEEPTAEPVQVASTASAGADTAAGAGARLDEEPVAISELEIVRMVEPEYPRRAWARDIKGWVDLEFIVTETGLTRAIEVTDAQHRGWFDRAAVDAVEQWRFAPEQHDGQTVERRAKVRLQFARD